MVTASGFAFMRRTMPLPQSIAQARRRKAGPNADAAKPPRYREEETLGALGGFRLSF